MTLEGLNGRIELTERTLIIKREGLKGLIFFGLKGGNREIQLSSISCIQFKKAGLTSGYIQFCFPGNETSKVKNVSQDENTIIFTSIKNQTFEKFKEYLEKRITAARKGDNQSIADQIPEWQPPSPHEEKLAHIKAAQTSRQLAKNITIFVFSILVIMGVVYIYNDFKDAWLKSDVEIQQQDKERQAEERIQDQAYARQMHVTYEQYVSAKKLVTDASATCRTTLKEKATWGADSDWLANYKWSTDGKMISIIGHDVKVKNAFNAERYVTYQCEYDPDSRTANILIVE